ncbi:uncharacterized protein F5147DRAFT_702229 [Suillus discolor]|uniref:Uncharacterized protein n=1 Tax=Suillus discolor TaxID=1912936 RepID=A0A9P7F5P5_9AGAM|nr:uncharacterized protein F5147DRAFT_702229 [Suillus discolor]KAG2105858.1 hypothetical protein F5147DRAFT_702229 [Suillus discolor]
MDGDCLSGEPQTLTPNISLSWQTLAPTSCSLTPAMSTSILTVTVTLTSIDVVPSLSVEPIFVDIEPASPITMAAIIGGTVVGVALLALLLTCIIVRSRRTGQRSSMTPFNHSSPAQRNITVPSPLSGRETFIIHPEYLDSCTTQNSRDGSPSTPSRVDPIPFQLFDDSDTSPSTVARRRRFYELDKLYPSCAHSQNGYRHDSGDNRAEHIIANHYSREPSEELPAYPRSGSRGADHDVLPSSHPSL